MSNATPQADLFTLPRLTGHPTFIIPTKQINSGEDLAFFLTSKAYHELKLWILQLARACLPTQHDKHVELHQLDQAIEYDSSIRAVRRLLSSLSSFIEDAPPDTGPRRFGNVAFRKWAALLTENANNLLDQHIAPILDSKHHPALVELKSYLLESFGSAQRLDYGTGHELSFLAFVGGLWKLGVFKNTWTMIAGIIEPYFHLVRTLIKTYTLEPAGSHGVWGLDDHSFIPYILGSAQLAPAITPSSPTPIEGSIDSAPDPASITSLATVNEQRSKNFYFAAIGFIFDVKKGPFFEHSPYLYNISGIKDGWGKINKGMLKMYDAEVLNKFPVVQHFTFGHLWQWEGGHVQPQSTVHTDSQPKSAYERRMGQSETTYRPGDAGGAGMSVPSTRAPWISNTGQAEVTRAPWSSSSGLPPPRTQR